MPSSLHVRMVDPSFSLFHYDVELSTALQYHVDDFSLWAPIALRDRSYPLPADMPPIHGVSLHGLTRGSGRLFGRPVQGYDYFLNEFYTAAGLLFARPKPIIHIQFLSLFGRSSLEARWLDWLKARSSHIVYTVHDVLPPDRHDNAALIAGYGRLYHLVDHLIVHTDYQQEQMVERFGVSRDKVSVVQMGPFFHRLQLPPRAEAAHRLGLDPSRPLLLHFGHMRPYKGTEGLIEAAALLRRQYPDLQLLLVGKATAERAQILRDCIHVHNLEAHVHCRFDYLPTSELAFYFAAADAIILPYLYIDQSGVLLSALGLGIPVVASAVGGMAEIIRGQDLGFICQPESPPDLATQLAFVLAHPAAARQKAERARRYVLTELGWPAIAAQTAAIYRMLLAS
jgi:glycosyltransferase involved in cell wall biosynthesis